MIPKIVHHVWPGNDAFREEFHAFRLSWLKHHPDWTFLFWRLSAPISSIDHEDVAKLLKNVGYSAVVKSDILRLYVLDRYGGLYVDTDFECLKPFDDLLESETGFFCGAEDERYLCTSLMGAVPHHPLVHMLLSAALLGISQNSVDTCNSRPNEITGPVLLTQMADGRSDVKIYPRSFFYPIHHSEMHRLQEQTPEAYAKHYWNGLGPKGWSKGKYHAARFWRRR